MEIISLNKPPIELRNGYKDKDRLEKLHDLPCIVCQKFHLKQTTRTIAHHFMGMGLGKKASDLLTIPLCEFHHQKGNCGEAIHQGRRTWEKNFGTQEELLKEVDELLK